MANKLYPCLWFSNNAEEAARFYCSVFRNSQITGSNPVVTTFASSGEKFMCLNGGTGSSFNSSISFYVDCETEQEVDEYWNALMDGGKVLMPLDKYDWSPRYGWLSDRYGLNWQLAAGKPGDVGQKFTPMLMFTGKEAGNAEKAIKFYTSIFNNSSLVGIMRYPAGQKDEGLIMHAQFKLDNYVLMCMDSTMDHKVNFNEAVSFVIECENQEEIDHYWDQLTAGGQENMCGWLKDQFGVSWQVVPKLLGALMNDQERSGRVMQAFMKMKKFDIQQLIEA